MHDDAETFDVIVAGLGAWGSATLRCLAARGHRVLGVDARRPPHRHGSHHGDGRVIRMTSPESPEYAPLMTRAYALWRELERTSRTELLVTPGAISAGPAGHAIVEGALASYRAGDVPHDVLDRRAAAARFPWLALAPDELVVFEPSGGVLRPEPAIRAQLALATGLGAEVRCDEPVLDWAPDDAGVRVTTTRGERRAARLVLTVGVAAPSLLHAELPIDVERQVVAVYETPDAARMAPIAVPSEHGECFYGLPEGRGRFKASIHHGGLLGQDGDAFLAAVTPDDLALIDTYVRARLPGLPARPVESYTCRYTNAPDVNFVLGEHPDAPAVLIATGDSGHGFKLAPVVGEILADLVEGQRPGTGIFAPGRFGAPPVTSG
ncbi:MAG TPA: N-methyl-L-tryptophan oxidase [Baekduia sp.]|uniref:N-methyl-L-tryptophan oxidase n=1 Tax=Baekduia sp. TaxID=2600305 RepID=UPI002D778610|nr:N-methyl-L-tryptophan oxidase [Baekduia sp.]HET6509110.1 N-methyl-L-tryptophan oxidase [Baekduia sp.]